MTRVPKGSRAAHPSSRSAKPNWRGEDPNLELEQARYAEPIASRELLLQYFSNSEQPLTTAQLAKRLGLHTEKERDALAKRLSAMVRDGQIIEGPSGFGLAGDGERVTGRLRGRASGEIQVLPDDGSPPLALARADAATLMHNDRVEVLAVGMNDRGRRIARLIRRLGEGPRRIGGTWRAAEGGGRVQPEDPGHWYGVWVSPKDRHGAREGDNVIVEIIKRPLGETPAHARVVEIVDATHPADLAARFAIVRHELPQAFPPDVLHEANLFGAVVTAEDRVGRVDLRHLPLVTIDGADAKDFDDAVYAEPANGGWRLVVAIADVSHYVRPGTHLDAEARARATSVYFPDRVIAMLPEHLSNHLCSLMPSVERLAFVCDMQVSSRGKPSNAKFYEAVIRSQERLTYDQAWATIGTSEAARRLAESPDGTPHDRLADAIRSSLEHLYSVYQVLKKARDARGALEFRGGEIKARIGDAGRIEGFHAVARNDAHRMIEECMVAANVEAAAALRAVKAGSLFRVHGQPEDKRVTELQRMLSALNVGVTLSEKPTPREFRRLTDKLAGRSDALLLESLVIRSLAQAVYQQTNIGHFGLALKEYAHFTSPIRRYPDLIVHRALKAALLPNSAAGRAYHTTELQALGAETSQRERRADEAARDVLAYLKCLYLERRVGEIFDATISSALEFGLFVQLKEAPIDGLVHISTIAGDFWELEPGGMGLVGQRTGRRWQMGDSVSVRLTKVNLLQRQIDFELANTEGATRGMVRAPRPGRSSGRSEKNGRKPRGERKSRGGVPRRSKKS